MKKTLAIVIVLTLVLIFVLSLTSCNETDYAEDYITVGLECGYAPYNWTQTDNGDGAVKIENADGYANGYDIMVAKRIAEYTGKKLKVYKYEWNALIPAVTSGSLDFIIAGMSPTDERKEAIDFTDVYYNGNLVIVVRKDGAYASARSLSDFDGAKLVAQKGTFHETALSEQADEYNISVQTPLETFPLMINALKTRAVDGYLAEEPGASADCKSNSEFVYIPLKNNITGFRASEEDTAIAIGLKKGSPYKQILNDFLATLSEDERLSLMTTATELSSAPHESKGSSFFEVIGSIVTDYSLWILKGIGLTLLVSVVGTVAGLVIGLIIGIIRTLPVNSDNKVGRVFKKIIDFLIGAYVEVFRGTPMMVQAMVIFWGYAYVSGGQTLNVTLSALFIVSINTGAYMAEIVRGGILSIDKGQFEGARAIGMNHFQTMIHVVIPQVMRNILPSVCNEFIINVKDTSVLNVIGFTELFFMTDSIAQKNYQVFITYLFSAAIYFILTFGISRILLLIERKIAGKKDFIIKGSGNMDAESIALTNEIGGNPND